MRDLGISILRTSLAFGMFLLMFWLATDVGGKSEAFAAGFAVVAVLLVDWNRES